MKTIDCDTSQYDPYFEGVDNDRDLIAYYRNASFFEFGEPDEDD